MFIISWSLSDLKPVNNQVGFHCHHLTGIGDMVNMKLAFLICLLVLTLEKQCETTQEFRLILNAIIPDNFQNGNIKLEYDFGVGHKLSAGNEERSCLPSCKSSFDLIADNSVDSSVIYKNCKDVPSSKGSGIYNLTLGEGQTKSVYCDIELTSDKKYLVIQRRLNGKEDFYRGWIDYENGFGNLMEEFWIGNRVLNMITASASYKLRIDMEAFDSTKAYAEYDSFSVGPPESKYALSVSGYSGSAGDSLSSHSGHSFSHHDQDNDADPNNCAQTYHGAWWFAKCHDSNLNGNYFNGSHQSYADGINWKDFRGYYESLKITEMKIIRTFEAGDVTERMPSLVPSK